MNGLAMGNSRDLVFYFNALYMDFVLGVNTM